jgi:DNA (cytosine-5)-methyltransferase 1
MPPVAAPTAVDLFAGAGGTTQGLKDAGFNVIAAIEINADAAESYRLNHPQVEVLERDIRRVQAPALARRLLADRRLDLLTACPPCQGFSTLGLNDRQDPRNTLIDSVRRFAESLRPRVIALENVPGLGADRRLGRLVEQLSESYRIARYVVDAAEFGVPQHRRRIIVLAVDRTLPAPPPNLVQALPEHFSVTVATAGDALAKAIDLDSITDPVQRARTPRPLTLQRIKAAPIGGGRADLPAELQLKCHTRLKHTDATNIYGRIDPTKPAPTMTTRCTTPSCGRFIHPVEDRGLTLREAALLQSFPLQYRFDGGYDSIERQIGNAVPVRLASAIGEVVRGLLSGHPATPA